ncbi:MAG: hydantoinase/oxoprolinase [Nitrososphaeraceae archaeon]|jgi:N-methylhydantoinase A/oxoprolinase/acetone carboxylase beta subunit|nr:hydantoinase/oxoprolinase [Nitrososphaeraceae archaeon]
MNRKIRLGIDVGGTFTKAIAIDIASGSFIGSTTVPTTHNSERGVAEGIILVLRELMKNYHIQRSEIELISHSTTQAVNALLEGDTAKVGIIGMGVGLEKSNVVKRTNIKDIELSLNKHLHTCYRFLDTSKYLEKDEVNAAILALKHEGAEVLVVSEAYGVDDPSNEQYVMTNSDIPITAGHELTGIYGLEIRTVTAAINAGIMPKAISTAKYVENVVRQENINCPIMVMKGDGGVTDIHTFKNKPILTILSGPAASVAGALLHSHILHGVFIEIGGTSTNISIIKNGKPEIRYVTIMDHPTCIRSVDVRVAGVAGGSLIRIAKNRIIDVGPRSAHIAGLKYSCFVEPKELENARIITFKPNDNDPGDYICIQTHDNKKIAITNTCAANALGLIMKEDYAFGNRVSAIRSLSLLGEKMGISYQEAAEMVLDFSIKKIFQIMDPMIKEYQLIETKTILIGGGGGASVLVPHMATKRKFHHQIAKNAEVVSSIGVAAAMIYEEIEKTVNKPDANDVSNIIDDIKKRALDRGAVPESISIQTEYVNERSLLRAIATGNVELDIGKNNRKEIDEKQATEIASSILENNNVQRILDMKNYYGFTCETIKKQFLIKKRKYPIVILDKFGRIRLMLDNAKIIKGNKNLKNEIDALIFQTNNKSNDDLAPQVHILDDMKIVDFSSLSSPQHLIDAIKKEIDKINTDKITIIIKI